jgi:predicted DNA-binding protein
MTKSDSKTTMVSMRLPIPLIQWLKKISKTTNRTVTGEVIHRLLESKKQTS